MSIRALIVTTALIVACASSAAAQDAPSSASEPRQWFKNGQYVMADGEAIYTHVCQGCHMADAKGAIGAGIYPSLAHDPRLSAAAYPIVVILKGQKAMPPFGDYLDDRQVAKVVTYLRTHFGNSYGETVTPADVKRLR